MRTRITAGRSAIFREVTGTAHPQTALHAHPASLTLKQSKTINSRPRPDRDNDKVMKVAGTNMGEQRGLVAGLSTCQAKSVAAVG